VADFDDIDALLSNSLKSAAEPANSAGVADVIRSRVAAGDAGTSVAGSTAPGWGGGSAAGILPWLGLIVVAGIVGGTVGATGVIGAPSSEVDGSVPAYVITPDVAPTYACPGGPRIGNMPANTRVLAVARDADGTFLGTRDPDDWSSTIWFEAGDVVTDDGADTASLPIEECPEVVVTVVTPTPTPEPTVEPDPGETDEPEPPADTTPPLATKMSANPTFVINGQSSLISVNASDDVGVTAVNLSWTGPNGLAGSGQMVPISGTWRYSWSHANMSNGFGLWTFTARAVDAAGNVSAPQQVVVERQYLG
jgi:hypothetical protein